jgi:hypothetical protein
MTPRRARLHAGKGSIVVSLIGAPVGGADMSLFMTGLMAGLMFDRVEPPAGGSGAGNGFVRFRPEGEGGNTGIFRCELQPAAGGQRYVRYLADDGGKPVAAQSFLHRPEGIRIAPGAHQDQPCRIDPELQQRRTV